MSCVKLSVDRMQLFVSDGKHDGEGMVGQSKESVGSAEHRVVQGNLKSFSDSCVRSQKVLSHRAEISMPICNTYITSAILLKDVWGASPFFLRSLLLLEALASLRPRERLTGARRSASRELF